ncbi:hypothetical protein ABZ419_09110 [Streptomyces cinnamoneus]|uniref:hypothetical protein n=1 Tax=Streptomyces cinnamoneus TaxID=53446 RepID=UPI0034112ECE
MNTQTQNPVEYAIQQDKQDRRPHSITVGPDGYLYVTTHYKCVMQINPNDPNTQVPKTSDMPTLSAGIIRDPKGLSSIWFASPAHEQEYDPIFEFEVAPEWRYLKKHDLGKDARAQTITQVRIMTHSYPPAWEDRVLFAEPIRKAVGYVKCGSSGANFHDMPKGAGNEIFDTWPWSVAASVSEDQKSFRYWVTGQKWDVNPHKRAVNGVYHFQPGLESKWHRIEMDKPTQVPVHIITDSQYVWVGTMNPNLIVRIDIKDGSTKSSQVELSGAPRQMIFGPDDRIWVAGSDKIYRFKKDDKITMDASVTLPDGSEALGLCLDANQKAVWYTNPRGRKIGRYKIPKAPKGLEGKTQLESKMVESLSPGETSDAPIVVRYVTDGNPIPNIPLTCRIVADEATFADGSREYVLHTDTAGRVVLPPVWAGNKAEEVRLEVAYADTEPPTTTTIRVGP